MSSAKKRPAQGKRNPGGARKPVRKQQPRKRPAKPKQRKPQPRKDQQRNAQPSKATPPTTDVIVAGQVSPWARIAGALGLVAAIGLLVRPFLPLAVVDADRVGSGPNVYDVLGWLPIAVVLGAGGVAALTGRMARVGLATVIAGGLLSAGQLLRWLWFTDSDLSTVDLPVGGQAVDAGRYDAGSGLVLAIVVAGVLILGLLIAVAGWGTTVLDDDGRFDALRPRYGGYGLIAGVLAAVAFGMQPHQSDIGIAPGNVLQATGLQRVGGLVFCIGIVACTVLAATLRPRRAGVAALMATATYLVGPAVDNLLVVTRSPDLGATFGTTAYLLAPVVVLLLALLMARARPSTNTGRRWSTETAA